MRKQQAKVFLPNEYQEALIENEVKVNKANDLTGEVIRNLVYLYSVVFILISSVRNGVL